MIIVDRVYCDCCRMPMGQLMSQPAQSSDLIADHGTAPDFAICPDCKPRFAACFACLCLGLPVPPEVAL